MPLRLLVPMSAFWNSHSQVSSTTRNIFRNIYMGGTHSKNTTTDLASIASQVDQSRSDPDGHKKWSSYDYVVVGGGEIVLFGDPSCF